MNHPTHAASAAGFLWLVFSLDYLNLGWEIDMTTISLWVANYYFTNDIKELVVATFCKQYYVDRRMVSTPISTLTI